MNDNLINSKYYIDASALIWIFRTYPRELRDPVWEKLKEIFKAGELISHRLVYNEITAFSKNPDLLSRNVIPLKDYFVTQQYSQVKLVSDIVYKFPGLIDPSREKEQADPWLIALAVKRKSKNHNEKIYVVSEESERSQTKIPAVCKSYDIEHLRLDGFYEKIGLGFKVVSKKL